MKIALIGYGKMGHMIEGIALERGHEIVGIIDPTLVNGDCSLVTDFDSEVFRSADVAIEFTTPATAKENVLRAWAQNVPVVCGTTGWKPEELRGEGLELREVDSRKLIVDSKTGKTMLVWSSNFSVGVNIFFEMNKFLAQKMKNLTPRGSMDVHRTSNRAEPFTHSREGLFFLALIFFYRFGRDGCGGLGLRRVVLLNVSCGSGDSPPCLATTDADSHGTKD